MSRFSVIRGLCEDMLVLGDLPTSPVSPSLKRPSQHEHWGVEELRLWKFLPQMKFIEVWLWSQECQNSQCWTLMRLGLLLKNKCHSINKGQKRQWELTAFHAPGWRKDSFHSFSICSKVEYFFFSHNECDIVKFLSHLLYDWLGGWGW